MVVWCYRIINRSSIGMKKYVSLHFQEDLMGERRSKRSPVSCPVLFSDSCPVEVTEEEVYFWILISSVFLFIYYIIIINPVLLLATVFIFIK